jgi:predicted Holliday junction resolvase-like endonuclease
MKKDIVLFFDMGRRIFGVCPCCGTLFRLSECRISVRGKPVRDWMDMLDAEERRLDHLEERLQEKIKMIRERSREVGRRQALRSVRKLDKLFTPRKLNPDDAKVIFHPVDYVVFNGLTSGGSVRDILLLDRGASDTDHRKIQRSIEKTVEKGRYEWRTLRVGETGEIKEE